nr:granzyme A-like isoform X2 [Pogona vitticeps]
MPSRGGNENLLPLYVHCILDVSLWGNTKQQLWGLSLLCAFLLPFSSSQYKEIIEKEETSSPSRPYMAALFRRRKFLCAGTLIKENWALTAAQCFPDEKAYIILGAKSRTKREKEKHIANITKIFSYPGFNRKTLENDIMLLQIQTRRRIKPSIKPIPLPKTSDDIKPGTHCIVAGWGTVHKNRGSDTLREDNIVIIDRRICNDKNHYNSHLVRINMGDSGGPLICNEEQKGIISFVKTCGDNRYPGVYTRLTKDHLSWIQGIITNNTNSH